MLATLLLLSGLMLLIAFAMGAYSHIAPETGLISGALRPCPDSPNCVCSEANDSGLHAYIEAIPVRSLAHHVAWQLIRDTIKAKGGNIVQDSDNYLHATFTSSVFRFVDDLELRLDVPGNRIQIRSASRIGHSDFGANRKRVEQIRAMYDRALAST